MVLKPYYPLFGVKALFGLMKAYSFGPLHRVTFHGKMKEEVLIGADDGRNPRRLE